MPKSFGAWKTAWRRHDKYSKDGIWDAVLTEAADADLIDWAVSVDSTVNRAHQHATNLSRDTGGSVELQESSRRAC